MVDIDSWMQEYAKSLHELFGDRVFFVGIQGSYARGEATETSDIDAVAVLDEVTLEDITAYGKMLDSLPYRDLTCGFFGGKEDLLNWEASELFQFYHDTTPIYGNLDFLLSKISDEDIDRSILQAACGVYHGCIHNMLFDKDEGIIKMLFKSASFAVQASVFRDTGRYEKRLPELAEVSTEHDRSIIRTYIDLKNNAPVDFHPMSKTLLEWAQSKIQCN